MDPDEIEIYAALKKMNYLPYSVGQIVVHDGMILHQIAPAKDIAQKMNVLLYKDTAFPPMVKYVFIGNGARRLIILPFLPLDPASPVITKQQSKANHFIRPTAWFIKA